MIFLKCGRKKAPLLLRFGSGLTPKSKPAVSDKHIKMSTWGTLTKQSTPVFLPNFDITIDIRELLQTFTTVHHNGLQNPPYQAQTRCRSRSNSLERSSSSTTVK